MSLEDILTELKPAATVSAHHLSWKDIMDKVSHPCVCVCVCCVCVRAYVCVCVWCVYVRACARVRACVHTCMHACNSSSRICQIAILYCTKLQNWMHCCHRCLGGSDYWMPETGKQLMQEPNVTNNFFFQSGMERFG